MKVFPIGRIESEGDETRIVLDEAWRSGLKGLESYGHVQVLYWLDGCDTPEGRGKTVEKKPYAHWPQSLEASGGFDWGAEFTF